MNRRLRVVSLMGPICAKHPPGRSGKLDLSPFSLPVTDLRHLPRKAPRPKSEQRPGWKWTETRTILSKSGTPAQWYITTPEIGLL